MALEANLPRGVVLGWAACAAVAFSAAAQDAPGVGDRVEVQQYGSWYAGTVTEVVGDVYEVRFDSNTGLERVSGGAPIRKLPRDRDPKAAVLDRAPKVAPGQAVEAYQYVWRPATVLETKGGQVRIRFDGDATDKWLGGFDVRLKGGLTTQPKAEDADYTPATAATVAARRPLAAPAVQPTTSAERTSGAALRPPRPGVYQCYMATSSVWTAGDYGDAPIAKLTLSPGGRFTYADSGGTYAVASDGTVKFQGLKASYYTGARLVQDGSKSAVQLQFGKYGVQNCTTK